MTYESILVCFICCLVVMVLNQDQYHGIYYNANIINILVNN